MCRTTPPTTKKAPTTAASGPPRLLLSLDSCAMEDQQPPPNHSIAYSGMIICGGLVASELFCRYVLAQYQHLHPLLENETNRQILARHLGVDTLSLGILGFLGWKARKIIWSVVEEWAFGKKGAVKMDDYNKRMFAVHPEGVRIATFFFWYQVKNSYDTIVWNDGPEYVFHHVFSLFTSWVAVGTPYFAHYYAVFFLALCEISTAVLCVLANFDDDHGVPGLGDAFPTAKMAVGAAFVVLFIICRCIAWPIYAYYFFKDTQRILKDQDERYLNPKRVWWLKFLNISLTSLSLLQLVFLGQIFMIGYEEMKNAGIVQ